MEFTRELNDVNGYLNNNLNESELRELLIRIGKIENNLLIPGHPGYPDQKQRLEAVKSKLDY